MTSEITRRRFIERTALLGGMATVGRAWAGHMVEDACAPLQPIGRARGIHPGRVVWVHDPEVTDWKGPGDGLWYEADRTKQERVDGMMTRAVCELTGEGSVSRAWDALFRHFNRARGGSDLSYQPGQRILIKPNWVGMIWHEGAVDPETYRLVKRLNYMNTAPQMLLALLRQLVGAVGVRAADITVCDTLAYIVSDYHDLLQAEYPQVRFVDYAGKFGRLKAQPSSEPLYWSCRPEGVATDTVPTCFAEADYLVNFANCKAHAGSGVTLCGKNHFGSLVRWPAEKGYHDMHPNSFSRETGIYREQVDLMGHAHLGGKTVLYLIDGLYSGVHSVDTEPRRWQSPPFNGHWTSSLLASQDPVAIDSVALDFLRAEWDDFPHHPGANDYLHEAALADNPPSGTFYDPNHAEPTQRLPSLGVHEHWNSPREKKYSRNLGVGEGIELVAADLA